MNSRVILALVLLSGVVACSDDDSNKADVPPDTTTPDTTTPDTTTPDTTTPDTTTPDTTTPDTTTPDTTTPDTTTADTTTEPPDANVINDSPILKNTVANSWYQAGATAAGSRVAVTEGKGKAKNIILFVGDGMGISTVTAARIREGQLKGGQGEDNVLSFESMPYAGLSRTYNVNAQTPDSAGTMTAMMTGVKTDAGVINVDEDVVRGDCSSQGGNELVSALRLAEIAGMSTGIVSTARITHATPAATYATSPDRNWEDNSDVRPDGVAAGCIDIALQLVNFENSLESEYPGLDVNGLEVAMGGGRRHFLPNNAAFNSPDALSDVEGDRTDGQDLTATWKDRYPDGTYIIDQAGFDAVDPETTPHLFGLFNESHMQYEADRLNDIAGEPTLQQMTEKAIALLDNNDKGYFLMVESGRIDHAHHAGNASSALTETIEFAEAVQAAMDATNPEETLIIVTADHSHVFTIAGYPKRGNPILGKVVSIGSNEPALAADGLPYTTLGYANGRGFHNSGAATDSDLIYKLLIAAGRRDLTGVDTEAPGYFQETIVPTSSETHGGEDVGIYALGPGASLVRGTNEQNVIFHIMDFASALVDKANAAILGQDSALDTR